MCSLQTGRLCVQTEAAALRKQLDELRTQLQRNEEMVRWLNNQVSGAICQPLGQRAAAVAQSATFVLPQRLCSPHRALMRVRTLYVVTPTDGNVGVK